MKNHVHAESSAHGPVILALGDSLTAGYGLRPGQSFAAQLQARLRPDFPAAQVINAGVSGDTTATALKRLPKLLSSLRRKPDLAIVELGANDLIRGMPLTHTKANLDAILIELARMDIPVLLAQMEAPAFLGAFGQACTNIYSELAARHRIESHPFLPPKLLGNGMMCLPDRIHPNAAGVGAIVAAFAPAVMKLLQKTRLRAA